MSTGLKFVRYAGILLLCAGTFSTAYGVTAKGQHKSSKKQQPQLPPLPSGPTGRPVPQIPLDSIAAVAPQVSFQNGQLTIVASNSTLGDILRAIKKQTGADIEVPSANERVVTRLGPGPARDVIAELLNGSRFNYVLLGSAENANLLTRVVLVPKTPGAETAVANNNPGQQPMGQAMMQQPQGMPPTQPEMATQDEPDTSADENAQQDDSSADQPAAEADQQQPADPNQGQSDIKTPQQMLQEMQQRQLQMQQQQQPGQPPVPGSGMPPHPPQQP